MVNNQSTPAHRPAFCWGCWTDTQTVDAKLHELLQAQQSESHRLAISAKEAESGRLRSEVAEAESRAGEAAEGRERAEAKLKEVRTVEIRFLNTLTYVLPHEFQYIFEP